MVCPDTSDRFIFICRFVFHALLPFGLHSGCKGETNLMEEPEVYCKNTTRVLCMGHVV